MTEADIKFRNYKVGKVTEVEAMKAPLKMCKVQVGEEEDSTLSIVTNAKHVDEGDIVVVALQGAVVPAGSDPEEDGVIKVGK